MKINEIISEDTDAASIATVATNMFAVPFKRNMPRKRPAKKEAAELGLPKSLDNILEQDNK